MFKRQVTVRMEKKDTKASTPQDPFVNESLFERKADHILHALESTGAKMFLGVCVYVVLDTIRQVQVAKASNPNN